MDSSITSTLAPQIRFLVATLIVGLFLFWVILKRLDVVRRFERKKLWVVAGVDLFLFPIAAFGFGLFVASTLGALGFHQARGFVSEATELLIYLAISVGVARVVEAWSLSQQTEGRGTRLSQLARSALFGACLLFGLLTFIMMNNYEATELYVSTGAIAAVLAFAMQQTLGDLFSGIALSIEKPFKIGDWLRFSDGTEGEVTDINWRATRLKGWDNTTYVVPNGQLSRQSFTNLHGPDHLFAPWYFVRVSGDVDPNEIKDLLEVAARRCDTILKSPAPVARLTDGSTVPYTYMVWVHFPNYPAMFAGREELYREIRATLLNAGLQLATEIQEIRVRSLEPEPRIRA